MSEYWSDIGTINQYIQSNEDVFLEECNFPHDKIVELQNGASYIADMSCEISQNVTFKGKSVIGKNTKIGKNSIIENSIIWDNVVISDGVHIENCVIASNCVIKMNLHSQIVGANELIEEKSLQV